MTEAVTVPSPWQPSRRAPVRSRSSLGALEALERGLALFRSTFSDEAWRYYVGSAPLVLCFIPIWVLNGQIRISSGALSLEATLLTAAYLLRVWMLRSYVQRIRERAFGTRSSSALGATARAAELGRLLAWKIVFSLGALSALPTLIGASWLYSACQFASLEAADSAERHSIGSCLALANQWLGDGLLLFLLLIPLWIAVWLNAMIVAIALPQLLHSILAVNTLLSTPMGTFALIRSSAFWFSLFAAAWLALDPIVKCAFVVVYQHLRSRREGDDLRGLLASLPREQQKKAQLVSAAGRAKVTIGAVIVLATILACASSRATATETQAPPTETGAKTPDDSGRDARVQELRHALNEESQRAIYRWHDAEHPSPPTWFDKLLTKIQRALSRAWDAFVDFLRKLWPRDWNFSPSGDAGAWQLKSLRFWLTLIATLTVGVGAVLFWLRRRRRDATTLSIPMAVAPLPELTDTTLASAHSEDEWFDLAGRLQGEGDLRFALRAAYLGLLAGLAQREWLTIRRDRTNREYLNEFTRRWRRRPQAAVEARAEVPEKLRGSLRQFDRVWYGSYVLTPEAVAAYRQDQRELLNHV